MQPARHPAEVHENSSNPPYAFDMRTGLRERPAFFAGTGTRPTRDPASERKSGDLEELQNSAVGIARARAQEHAAHQPTQLRIGGFKPGHGAKIDRTLIDRLAAKQAFHDLGRRTPQAGRFYIDARRSRSRSRIAYGFR